MASNTPNLGLLKKDPATDGNETFNIKTMLNDNWDKIDEAVGNIQVNVPDASLNQKGIVQLSNAANSISEKEAATPKAVNEALNSAIKYVDNKPANAVSYTTQNRFYYVDSVNGDDNNTGMSEKQAFKTVYKAVRSIPEIVNHQCIITLLPGTYDSIRISDKTGKSDIWIRSETNNLSNVIVKSVEFQNVTIAGGIYVRDITVEETVHFQNTSYASVYNVITSGKIRNGINASYFSTVQIDGCSISNKSIAIEATYGARIFSMDNSGQSNSFAFSARYGGIVHKTGSNPSASTIASSSEGGVIFQ